MLHIQQTGHLPLGHTFAFVTSKYPSPPIFTVCSLFEARIPYPLLRACTIILMVFCEGNSCFFLGHCTISWWLNYFSTANSSVKTEKQCLSRGCCWSPASEPPSPHNLVPWCFFTPNRTFYRVRESKTYRDRLDLVLTLTSPEDPKNNYLPDVVKNLKVELIDHGKNVARVRITDFDNPRFEVPNLKCELCLCRWDGCLNNAYSDCTHRILLLKRPSLIHFGYPK